MHAITFIDQYHDIGGGQKSLLAIISIAKDNDYAIRVLAPGGGSFESAIALNVPSASFSAQKECRLQKGRKTLSDILSYIPYLFRSFMTIVRELDGIAYVNGPRLFLPAIVASLFRKAPFIYHVRIDHSIWEKRIIALAAYCPRTTKVVFNSSFLLERFLEDLPNLRTNKLKVLQNSLYRPFEDLAFKDRFPPIAPTLTIAIIGRVCPEKGQETAVALVEEFKHLNVYLIGKCDEKDITYLNTILSDGCGRIIHMGFESDIPSAINRLGVNLSIVPSKWNEAFGLVAIESMAMSCITITSSVGMLPMIAQKTGALTFKTTKELIVIVSHIIAQEPNELRLLAENQHKKTKLHYSLERFSMEVQNLLTEARRD